MGFSKKLESLRSIPAESIATIESLEAVEENGTEDQIESMFQNSEEQAIYHIAGVVLRTLRDRGSLCDQCIDSCRIKKYKLDCLGTVYCIARLYRTLSDLREFGKL